MADRNGYIGRAPSDSAVVVARQTFSPTGVTTDFTFASGYSIGYVDAYLNGARLIEGQDYTATDGSVVSLVSSATSGDVLELVAYKAFNVGNVTNATGDFTVGGKLTVVGVTSASSANYTGNVTVDGDITSGTGVNIVGGGLTVTGISTFYNNVIVGSSVTMTGSGISVVGIVTASGFVDDGTNLLTAINTKASTGKAIAMAMVFG